MNKELKQKWIDALKSGKYAQGREVLRDTDDRYCCLGVLCDIVAPDDWFLDEYIQEDWDGASEEVARWLYSSNEDVLPLEICDYATIESAGRFELNEEYRELLLSKLSESGQVILEKVTKQLPKYRTLANLNDSGMSFEDIALVIEHVTLVGSSVEH